MRRPSRFALLLNTSLLVASVCIGVLTGHEANWNFQILALLCAFAVASFG